MNVLEIKKKFHNLIDSIDNEVVLMNFYELVKNRSSVPIGSLWNKMSTEEQDDLLQTLEATNNPKNLISHEKMEKKHRKWL